MRIYFLLIVIFISSCATSPMGRKQFIIFGDEEMNQLGLASFQELKKTTQISYDTQSQHYVECVANAIIKVLPQQWKSQPWEVVLFEDNSANAFALPGGKIGVHTGLLRVAVNQDQLAAVLGHEIAHVLSRHGAERVSQQVGLELALQTADAMSQDRMENSENQGLLMSALGLGAQLGVLLPFSRTHESEADLYGVDLMAKAGFDPRQSINLWQNMAAASNSNTPQFLSTHPNPQNRIKKLSEYMPHALQLQTAAHQQGKRPRCR